MRTYPRLALDIGWDNLASALLPPLDSEDKIARFSPEGRTLVAGLSVRTLFDALLGALDLPPGSEVLMSAVNVAGMADIVRGRGLIVTAVDIDADTLASRPEALAEAAGPNARVFLTAHLFGAVTSLQAYASVCRERGLLLVEDRAQAFAGKLEADPAADATLYSFGPIKTATALGGGVALFADPDLAEGVRAQLLEGPALSDFWFLKRTLKYAALKLASTPGVYGLVLSALRWAGRDPDVVIAGSVRGFGSDALLARIRKRPPPRLLALMARRLARAGDPRARRERALSLIARLKDFERPGVGAERHHHWVLPILAPDPEVLVARLRGGGFDATRGATSLRAFGEAPNARDLLARAVYLPLSPFTSARTLARMAELLNTTPAAVRPAPL